MKNRLRHLLLALCAVVGMAALTGCSGHSPKDLLSTVPADASAVMVINPSPVLKALDVKRDGSGYTCCSELRELLALSGVSKTDISKALEASELVDGPAVTFIDRGNALTTFFVKDVDKMKKTLQDAIPGFDLEKEDGMLTGLDGTMIVDGKQVWMSQMGTIDADDVKGYKKQKDNFAGKYPKFTEQLIAENNVVGIFFDVDKMSSLMRLGGEEQAAQFLQGISAMGYKDAAFGLTTVTLTEEKMEATGAVYNQREELAEVVLPGKPINTGAMAKIDNNAPIVIAVEITKEMMEKAGNLLAMATGSQEAAQIVSAIAGTTCFSFTDPLSWTLSIGMTSQQLATEVGQYLTQEGLPGTCSTAGNYLIIRSPQPQPVGGAAPKGFKDAWIAFNVDFSKLPDSMVSGHDFSRLGTLLATVGPDGKGARGKLTWTCRHPLRTLLAEFMSAAQDYASGKLTFPFQNPEELMDDEMPLDSAAVFTDDDLMIDTAAGVWD